MTSELTKLKRVAQELYSLLTREGSDENPQVHGIAQRFHKTVEALPATERENLRPILHHIEQFLIVQNQSPVNVKYTLLSSVDALLCELQGEAA